MSLTAASGNVIKITGIGHDNNVTCVGSGDRNQPNITYNVGTKHTFDAVQLYEAASLSLTSSSGNYHVFWPQATVEPERIAEQIAQDITALKTQVVELQKQRDALLRNQTEVGGTQALNGYGIHQELQTTGVRCGVRDYLVGVDFVWSGTCHGQCDQDGGIVSKVKAVCRKF